MQTPDTHSPQICCNSSVRHDITVQDAIVGLGREDSLKTEQDLHMCQSSCPSIVDATDCCAHTHNPFWCELQSRHA